MRATPCGLRAFRYALRVTAITRLARLASFRLWLAAGAVLLGSWIVGALSIQAVRLAMDSLVAAADLPPMLRSVLISLVPAVAIAATVEGCKAAALVWPLRRQWDRWALLGFAFGLLQAATLLLGWLSDRTQFGPRIAPFSPMLLVAAANLVILHWALGRIAASAARPPGGPWLAVLLATVASALVALLPLQPLVFLVQLPREAFMAEPWIKAAMPTLLALAVWRWLPPPSEHAPRGPARAIAVALMGLVCCAAGANAVAIAILGPDRSDPVRVFVVALGAAFVAWMLFRQILLNWVRQSD